MCARKRIVGRRLALARHNTPFPGKSSSCRKRLNNSVEKSFCSKSRADKRSKVTIGAKQIIERQNKRDDRCGNDRHVRTVWGG